MKSLRPVAFGIVALCLALLLGGTKSFAADNGNPPWYPSLMAFEHYDSERTHLFEQAEFNGSFDTQNTVEMRTTVDTLPTPYNVVYLGPDSLFVYGGGERDNGSM